MVKSNPELNILNKINDLFKSIPNDSFINEDDEEAIEPVNTIYFKNNLVLFNGENSLSPFAICQLDINDKKLNFLKDKYFKLNCKEFFDYLKEGKVTDKIIIKDKSIQFKTDKMDYPFINTIDNDDENHINYIISKLKKFKTLTNGIDKTKFSFSKELIDEFKAKGIYKLYFNENNIIESVDNNSYFRINIFHKYLVKIAKTSTVDVIVYHIDDNYKLLKFIINTNGFKCNQYFKIYLN